MSPDPQPALVDAFEKGGDGIVSAARSGGASIVRAGTSGQAKLAAAYGDIERMSSALSSHTSFIQSQVLQVAQIAGNADLLASLPLSPATGVAAEAAVVFAAGRLAAHVVIAEGLAIVAVTIVSTYQLADAALQLALADVEASFLVVGAIGTAGVRLSVAQVETEVSAAILVVGAVVLLDVAAAALEIGAAMEAVRSLEQALGQSLEYYRSHPELALGGILPFTALTLGLAEYNYSVSRASGNSIDLLQGLIGSTGPYYDDILKGLIANGNNFGLFQDGTAELGDSVLDPATQTRRLQDSLDLSIQAVPGLVPDLDVNEAGKIQPRDVATLFAGARQIDVLGHEDEAVIRIITNTDAAGHVSYTVQIPSTQVWDPHAGAAPDDVTSDVYAMLHRDQTALAQAVYAAMRAAGIHDEPVMLVGFSLGGITAGAIAAGHEGFHITQVVTAGAPIGQMDIPPGVHVTSLEANEDPVPTLDGRSNPDTANWNTVHEPGQSLATDKQGEPVNVVNAHDANRYAAMAQHHSEINNDAGIGAFLNGKEDVHDYYATRR